MFSGFMNVSSKKTGRWSAWRLDIFVFLVRVKSIVEGLWDSVCGLQRRRSLYVFHLCG